MRCENPESCDLIHQSNHYLGTICLRHPQIAPHHSLVLSVHLMNYSRLAGIVAQVSLSVPSSVTCPVSSWRQPTPQPATIICISVPQYIFFTHPPFWFFIRDWEDIGWRVYWLGFASRPLSYQLLETTHQCPIGFRKFTPGKIPRCVYSAVSLIMTDSSP